MRTTIWWIQLLALSQAASLTLKPQQQSTIIEVALRFHRPETIANQIALLLMPKRDLLHNITDMLDQLRLDRINADIDHEAFVDEHNIAISTINKTLIEARTALREKMQHVRDLDDEMETISDDIDELETDADECLSESRPFASAANSLVAEHAERQKRHETLGQQYYTALETLDHLTERLTIEEMIAEIHKLDLDADLVADCTATVREANSTDTLRLIWQRIVQRLDLLEAAQAGAETRFNLTISEYRAVLGEYRAEYESIKADLDQLEADEQQLIDKSDEIQADIDSIEESMEELQSTIKSLFRSQAKEQVEYTVRTKLTNAELDDLDAAAMLINENMDGDTWPGLCHVGEPGCRRCLYDDNCLDDGQICSDDGLCMDEE